MRALVVLVTLVTLVALAVPSSASAGGVQELSYGSPLFTTRAMESLRIAEEFWGSGKPCPRTLVYEAPSAQLSRATETPGTAGTTDYCNIWIATELSSNSYDLRIAVCGIIVHEYGHALGYGHSTYHRSVMYTNRNQRQVVYECYKRFMPRGMWSEWRSMFGGPPLWLTK